MFLAPAPPCLGLLAAGALAEPLQPLDNPPAGLLIFVLARLLVIRPLPAEPRDGLPRALLAFASLEDVDRLADADLRSIGFVGQELGVEALLGGGN